MKPKPCTQEGLHTRAPVGYLAWHEWAERKAKTHDQERCPGCGLFKVWRSRKTGRRSS